MAGRVCDVALGGWRFEPIDPHTCSCKGCTAIGSQFGRGTLVHNSRGREEVCLKVIRGQYVSGALVHNGRGGRRFARR